MIEIRDISLPIDKSIPVEQIMGKKVLSKEGKDIGIIDNIFVNPDDLNVEALSVKKGMFSEDYCIGSDYLDKITEDGALLKINPSKEIEGKKVFDKDGKEIGKVKEIKRVGTTNLIQSVVVKRGLGDEDVEIFEKDIDTIGENLILEKGYKK